ncbi:DUF4190 domain-containing protein [Actinomyces bowdenii]|uniref:DUF4190 domain-containing protein n=1 Tax=Actinomyces bowdenii TaxID=131109 RepID=UPI00214BAAD3|nr:DUF4190 domain-containing protein [Actinomyces bowdenii]MCR2051264.1 DUF4190 domain-containing protein [Actinomyces bowdenii]
MSTSAPGHHWQAASAHASAGRGPQAVGMVGGVAVDLSSDRLPVDFVFPGTEEVNPFTVFSGPGYQAPQPRTDPAATGALVFALLSFIPCAGLLAAVLGWWSLRRLRRSWTTGQALAWLGVVVGTATTVFWLWFAWMTVASP